MNIQTKAGLVLIAVLMAACSTAPVTVPVGKPPEQAKIPQDMKQCQNIEMVLQPIVVSMVAQKIPYSQSPSNEWRDCSGNFLRLSSYVANQCPGVQLVAPPGVTAYTKGGRNKAPGGEQARSN